MAWDPDHATKSPEEREALGLIPVGRTYGADSTNPNDIIVEKNRVEWVGRYALH